MKVAPHSIRYTNHVSEREAEIQPVLCPEAIPKERVSGRSTPGAFEWDPTRKFAEVWAELPSPRPHYAILDAATSSAASAPCFERTVFTSAWSAFESFRSARNEILREARQEVLTVRAS